MPNQMPSQQNFNREGREGEITLSALVVSMSKEGVCALPSGISTSIDGTGLSRG